MGSLLSVSEIPWIDIWKTVHIVVHVKEHTPIDLNIYCRCLFTCTIMWFEHIFIVLKYNNYWDWAQVLWLRPLCHAMQPVFSVFTNFFQEKKKDKIIWFPLTCTCQYKISLIKIFIFIQTDYIFSMIQNRLSVLQCAI